MTQPKSSRIAKIGDYSLYPFSASMFAVLDKDGIIIATYADEDAAKAYAERCAEAAKIAPFHLDAFRLED
jgi:hypothetical protein